MGTMTGEATAAPEETTSAGMVAKCTSKTGGKAVVARKSSKAAEKDVRTREKILERLCVKGQREADRRSNQLSELPGEPSHSNWLYLLGLFPGGAGEQFSPQSSLLPISSAGLELSIRPAYNCRDF